jgi:hypothetical protein
MRAKAISAVCGVLVFLALGSGVVGVIAILAPGLAEAAPFQGGDIFAAVGDANLDGTSEVFRYNSAGVFQERLDLTGSSGLSLGMAFDSSGNLYVTAAFNNRVVKFDTNGGLVGTFASGMSVPESIVFDNSGNAYVSSVGGTGIRKFNSSGTLLGTFLPGTRVDWMDLAADQVTMLWGNEGPAINRVNVSSPPGTALTPFVANTGGSVFAIRILADGSVLVADGVNVKLYNAAGVLVRTYDIAGSQLWFALNLNPDALSFWSGDLFNGNLYEFDILCGGVANCTTTTQSILTGVPNQQPTRALAGLAIFGEPVAGCPTCPPPPGGGPPPGGSVPAPASLLLLGCGVAAVGLVAWRRRPRSSA